MFKHIWSVICRQSNIDKDSNTVSLFNVLEQLEIGIAPIEDTNKIPDAINVPIEYEVITLWGKVGTTKEAVLEQRITVLNPENKEVANFDQKAVCPESSRRLRTRYKMNGFVATTPGNYVFQIKIKGSKGEYQLVSEVPIEVNIKIEQESVKK